MENRPPASPDMGVLFGVMQPRDWHTLPVRQWEPTRFWVQSQTRPDVEHLVDTDPFGCSCEWSGDYKREGTSKKECVHIRRVRLWLSNRVIYKTEHADY